MSNYYLVQGLLLRFNYTIFGSLYWRRTNWLIIFPIGRWHKYGTIKHSFFFEVRQTLNCISAKMKSSAKTEGKVWYFPPFNKKKCAYISVAVNQAERKWLNKFTICKQIYSATNIKLKFLGKAAPSSNWDSVYPTFPMVTILLILIVHISGIF